MLTVAFNGSTMSRTQVQLWYNRFKEGWKNVNNDARPMKTLKQGRKWFCIGFEKARFRSVTNIGKALA